MENTTKYGIAGLVGLLIIFGGTIYLTQDEFDNAYVCTTTEEWGLFYGGVSSTGLTAYPFKENRTQYKRCIDGKWISLEKYAKEKGKNPFEVIQNKQVYVEETQQQYSSVIICNGKHWQVPDNPTPYTKIKSLTGEQTYYDECQ